MIGVQQFQVAKIERGHEGAVCGRFRNVGAKLITRDVDDNGLARINVTPKVTIRGASELYSEVKIG